MMDKIESDVKELCRKLRTLKQDAPGLARMAGFYADGKAAEVLEIEANADDVLYRGVLEAVARYLKEAL